MAITSAVGDLFNSVYELAASILGAVYSALLSLLHLVLNLFTSFLNFVGHVFSGVLDLLRGTAHFIAENIVLIGLVVAAAFAFVRYQNSQASTAQGKKKA